MISRFVKFLSAFRLLSVPTPCRSWAMLSDGDSCLASLAPSVPQNLWLVFLVFPVMDLWWLRIPKSLSGMSRLSDSRSQVSRVVHCTSYAVNSTPQSTNQKDTGDDTAFGGKGYHCEEIVRRRQMQQSANVCPPSQGTSTWKWPNGLSICVWNTCAPLLPNDLWRLTIGCCGGQQPIGNPVLRFGPHLIN